MGVCARICFHLSVNSDSGEKFHDLDYKSVHRENVLQTGGAFHFRYGEAGALTHGGDEEPVFTWHLPRCSTLSPQCPQTAPLLSP